MQFCFSFNYYDSNTTAIQHDTFAVTDPGEGPGTPLIFKPKWNPKGQKNFFGDRPPPPPALSQGLFPALICALYFNNMM